MDVNGLLAFGWAPSGFELVVVLVIALLLFGKRLPEVARGLGKGIVEFKKGVKGIEDNVNSDYEPPQQQAYSEPAESAPKSEEADSSGGGTPKP